MPSADQLQLALRQESDRYKLERVGVLAAQRIGIRLHMAAIYATRIGHETGPAVRIVLLGNPRLGHDGLPSLLTKGMAAAHLTGRRRVLLTAAPQFRARSGYKLAGSAYDEALAFLQKKLHITPQALAALEKQYAPEAVRISQNLAGFLDKRLGELSKDATKRGLSMRDAIRNLRQSLTNAGVIPQNDYALKSLFRTQLQTAYGAGRWQSLQQAELQDKLWGFDYVAIEDSHTTSLCRSLDRIRRPKDDPFWDTFWPPNHWNCRSAAVEVFDEAKSRGELPEGAVPDQDFDGNAGQAIADVQSHATFYGSSDAPQQQTSKTPASQPLTDKQLHALSDEDVEAIVKQAEKRLDLVTEKPSATDITRGPNGSVVTVQIRTRAQLNYIRSHPEFADEIIAEFRKHGEQVIAVTIENDDKAIAANAEAVLTLQERRYLEEYNQRKALRDEFAEYAANDTRELQDLVNLSHERQLSDEEQRRLDVLVLHRSLARESYTLWERELRNDPRKANTRLRAFLAAQKPYQAGLSPRAEAEFNYELTQLFKSGPADETTINKLRNEMIRKFGDHAERRGLEYQEKQEADKDNQPSREVIDMAVEDRLKFALRQMLDGDLPDALKARIRDLLETNNLTVFLGLTAVGIAVETTPIGWIADLFFAVLVGVDSVKASMAGYEAMSLLMNAQSKGDLRRASEQLSMVLVNLGVDLGLITAVHGAGKWVKASAERSVLDALERQKAKIAAEAAEAKRIRAARAVQIRKDLFESPRSRMGQPPEDVVEEPTPATPNPAETPATEQPQQRNWQPQQQQQQQAKAPFYKINDGSEIFGQMNRSGIVEYQIAAPKSSSVRGRTLFSEMMDHFGASVKGVRGNWTYGDNLASFNAEIARGVAPEEAAKNTFTGHMAGKYGFSRVTIVNTEGTPGNYTKVDVLFEK